MIDQSSEPLLPGNMPNAKLPATKPFNYKMPKYLKYALRMELALLITSLGVYLLLQYFGATYRFDKNSAIDFLQTTSNVLQKHKSITVDGFDTVRLEMAKALSVNNYKSANIENFFPDSDKQLFVNTFNAQRTQSLSDKLKLLPDTSFHQKFTLVSLIKSKVGDDFYSKMNLDQFVTSNGFWNNLEDDPLKYFCIVVAFVLLATMAIAYYDLKRQHRHFERAIQIQKAYSTSADITESWITAQTMLDTYHQRNLNQNNWTFRLSVIVMTIGCGIIFYGIHKAIGLNAHAAGVKGVNDGTSLIAILSTASGVVVNLIGGTFLAIYNSTLKQAIDYTNSLQKTSTVGTSLAILKSIEIAQQAGTPDPETTGKLIDAKIAIAKQLIGVTGP